MDRQIAQRVISANVRAEVARRALRQTEIAAVLNVTQSQVSKRLLGQIPFSATELVLLADLLDVAPSAFLDGVGVAA